MVDPEKGRGSLKTEIRSTPWGAALLQPAPRRTVLMIAYHYPPEGSSSGIQRTLTFTQVLPEHGWQPSVLTAHPRAYTVARPDQVPDIPREVEVVRAFALDSARHLGYGGRHLSFTALPDRWVSWWPGAVAAGLRLIRKHRPSVLWSTYPIATAHLIGRTLQRLSGLPWVADFRDSMTEDDYPPDERQRSIYRWVERKTMAHCAKAVFTTPGALRMYRERYPELPAGRFDVIANGYDEESFAAAEALAPRPAGAPIVLLHSGLLYPSERDPRCFYRALASLAQAGELAPGRLKVVLRATGHDEHHRALIEASGLKEIVLLAPPLPYREALREMMDADGLLVFQASNCNHQIPAKIYEYFRAKRPILALTDPRGDTAAAIRDLGFDFIAPLDDETAIRTTLVEFLRAVREGDVRLPSNEAIRRHSRRSRTAELARVLDEVASVCYGSHRSTPT
jgi:glycosyltransferase involved in cell wall biosynthesis